MNGKSTRQELAQSEGENSYEITRRAVKLGWYPDPWGLWVHKDYPDQIGYESAWHVLQDRTKGWAAKSS